ncbi:ApaG domain protein [Chloroherpeton thalassium ATCC 35110]|uniref:ApaG domain protein n=1 Tax=Chloroherpeton thalassium (strain ATCC 35110 / GB-78) TaxID=517418 RepID=B3QU12_CHLT3|nr:ApaG domain [Chloroherpeton thalassium]ACF12810.1 ApaG domain protein [Chloroherpeton thalassium ATCC 35110]
MTSDICTVSIDSLEDISQRKLQPPYKYAHAYTITIHNISTYTVQIKSRMWIVKDGDMKDRVVEGDGIVGHKPILMPGDTFTYTSYHVMLNRFGSALGKYFGTYAYVPEFEQESLFDDDEFEGDEFEVNIPEIQLIHKLRPGA